MAREAWPEVLRPALADKQGSALFIGTPRGFNHFFDLYQAAEKQPDWTRFQYTTEEGGNVVAKELESATHELDSRTYRQEFQASFENLTDGLVYYSFDRTDNVAPCQYDRWLPLFWSLDFNVNPMCSVIGQRDGDKVHVLNELALPDSNTWKSCEAFLQKIAQWNVSPHTTRITIYGDATGNSRHSAASRTDWQILREFFRRHGYQIRIEVPSSNPSVKDRVNCVNAMLLNQAGERRLIVDPACKQLILDFERVHWKADVNGNSLPDIDKSDPARSHVSDALGYMIAREFGMQGTCGEMPYSLI